MKNNNFLFKSVVIVMSNATFINYFTIFLQTIDVAKFFFFDWNAIEVVANSY